MRGIFIVYLYYKNKEVMKNLSNDRIKEILDYSQHIHKIDLEDMVGCRFRSLEEIEGYLSSIGAPNPKVIFSESDILEGYDDAIDGRLDGENDFTLYYIKDNSGMFYITEVC